MTFDYIKLTAVSTQVPRLTLQRAIGFRFSERVGGQVGGWDTRKCI